MVPMTEVEWLAAREKDIESHRSEVPDWKLVSSFPTLNFFNPER